MNPFDLPGPQFLGLYAAVLLGGILVAFLMRWLMRLPADEPHAEALDLSPYEVAFLSGGARRAIDAAIVRLSHCGALSLDASTGGMLQRGEAPPDGAHPLEKAVHGAAGQAQGKRVAELRAAVTNTAEKLRARLDELGLLLSEGQVAGVRLTSAGIILAVGLFGLTKLFVGVARHRPVGFLVMFLIVTAVVAAAFLFKTPFRTRRGDGLLRRFRNDNAALEFAAGRRVGELTDADLLLAMGLFGMGVLAGGALGKLQAALRAPPVRVSPSGSSCSSWFFTSSCGGGGGGCGGGGGGGCGGGG